MQSRIKGIGLISLLILGVLIYFVGLIGLKVVPLYLNDYTVSSCLNLSNADNSLKNSDDVRKKIQACFDINNIDRVSALEIQINQTPGRYDLKLNYDVPVSIYKQVDLVFHFNHDEVVDNSAK